MKNTAIFLVGVLLGITAWLTGPMFEKAPVRGIVIDATFDWIWLELTEFVTYVLVVTTLLGSALSVFRTMWLSTHRAELASLIALGGTRKSLISDQARAGLRDGSVAASLVAIAAVGRQATVGLAGVEFVPSVAFACGALISAALISFTVAYAVAAWWTTRGSVRDVASGNMADARVQSRTASPGRSSRGIWIGVASVALVVASVTLVVGPWQLDRSGEPFSFSNVVGTFADFIVSITLYLVVPAALAFLAATVTVRIARKISRGLAAHALPGSGRALAADGLARPTPLRTAAAGAVVAVMGGAVVITATYFAQADMDETASRLVPPAHLSTMPIWDYDRAQEFGETGWAEPLPADLVAELQADPKIIAVEAGAILTDAAPHPFSDDGNDSRDLLLAVDTAQLDVVNPHASTRLYMVDDVVTTHGIYGWADGLDQRNPQIQIHGEHTDVTVARMAGPWAGVSRMWAEESWGPVPTSTLLLYPAGEEPLQVALADHDLQGFTVETSNTILTWNDTANESTVAALTTPFMLVAVAMVIALAWSGQRLRARDHATLLALGAKPASLRVATALEAGLLTMVAAAIGVITGGLLGPTWTAITMAPWEMAPLELLLWNIGYNLALIPWAVFLTLAIAAAVLAAAGAALIRVRLERFTPAHQLAEAERAGVA